MTLIRRRPLGVNSIFDEFFDHAVGKTNGWSISNYPAINIKKADDKYEVEFAAPGLNKADFNIEVNDGTLTVSYEKKSENEEKSNDGNYTRREFSYSSFSRSFTLPNEVNEEQINAKYENGILRVSIPQAEAEIKKPKLIEIA